MKEMKSRDFKDMLKQIGHDTSSFEVSMHKNLGSILQNKKEFKRAKKITKKLANNKPDYNYFWKVRLKRLRQYFKTV